MTTRSPLFVVIVITLLLTLALPDNIDAQTTDLTTPKPESTTSVTNALASVSVTPTKPDPTTPDPTTPDPTTPDSTTYNPTTLPSTSAGSATPNSSTSDPTTSHPTTTYPTTPPEPTITNPTTLNPTTLNPTTLNPTTPDLSTHQDPTASDPTTFDSTTLNPTTSHPSTLNPTTPDLSTHQDPTASDPTTFDSTTLNPTTSHRSTLNPTTLQPTTYNPTTPDPTVPDITTPESTPVILLDDYQLQVLWTPKYKPSVIIETDPWYMISAKIESCNLDGENGEYNSISTGKPNETIRFTYRVNNKPIYLFNSNRLYVDFVGTHVNNFSATFTRLAGASTTSTTEISTTQDQDWPTPSLNYSHYLTVFITLQARYGPEEIENSFRKKVSQMAAEYCENENFKLARDITENNVHCTTILPCSPNWPGHDTCVQVTFSVPVLLNGTSDSQWTGYQLSGSHLKIMWDRYSWKYFNDDMNIYVEPHLQSMLTNRIIIISLVTIGFALGLLAVRFISIKISRKGRADVDDKTPIINSGDGRDSRFSLSPHHFQEMPPLFENKYSNFNPEREFGKVPPITTDIRRASVQESDI